MFVESLLESSAPSRRGWTTLLSFGLQAAAIVLLVLTPLFYTQALPNFVQRFIALPVPPGPPPPRDSAPRHAGASQSEVIGETVRQPPRIPDHTPIIHDEQPLQPPSAADIGVPGGVGNDANWHQSPLNEIIAAYSPPPPTPMHMKVSEGVSQGYLIYQVKPAYPHLARISHVQGTVLLNAAISRAGVIENLRALSGHPLLVPAAIEAVRQWRYRPYLLNGRPVEVETQITVRFTLSPGS